MLSQSRSFEAGRTWTPISVIAAMVIRSFPCRERRGSGLMAHRQWLLAPDGSVNSAKRSEVLRVVEKIDDRSRVRAMPRCITKRWPTWRTSARWQRRKPPESVSFAWRATASNDIARWTPNIGVAESRLKLVRSTSSRRTSTTPRNGSAFGAGHPKRAVSLRLSRCSLAHHVA